MGKPSAPPAPDYTGAAKETAAGNLDAARQATAANRVNTYTPYGNLEYFQDSNNPDKWTSMVSLSPDQQALLDQQNKTSLNLANMQDLATTRVQRAFGNALPTTLNADKMPAPTTFDPSQSQSPTAFNAGLYSGATTYDPRSAKLGGAYDPTQATNNASDLINARLLPQQQRDRADLENQLANQGIMPGSEAYQRAEDQLGRDQNDARQQAQLQGITLGQQQQAQTFGQMSDNAQLQAQLQGQQYGQQTNNDALSAARQAQQYGQQLQNQTTRAQLQAQQFGQQTQNRMNQAQLQQQQYTQQAANRNIPINELNALRTGSQVSNPTFQQSPQQATTAGPDVFGAANGLGQYNLGLYNAQVGSSNSTNGAMAGLGTAAMMMYMY